jgi:hypothetical protein
VTRLPWKLIDPKRPGGWVAVTVFRAVQVDGGPHVNVADAVSVREAEFPVVAEIGEDPFDAPADHGPFAGVD